MKLEEQFRLTRNYIELALDNAAKKYCLNNTFPQKYYRQTNEETIEEFNLIDIQYAAHGLLYRAGIVDQRINKIVLEKTVKLMDLVDNSIDSLIEINKIYCYYKSEYSHLTVFPFSSTPRRDLFETVEEATEEFKRIKYMREFRIKHAKPIGFDYKKEGYNFLGWQNGWKHVYLDSEGVDINISGKEKRSFTFCKENHPEWTNCNQSGHTTIHVQERPSGADNTVSCPICKIYWKYDSSG